MLNRRKKRFYGSFLLAASMFLMVPVGAQQADPQENEASAAAPAEEYDITGGKSARQLQNELNKIESSFFKAFNKVNTNKDFNVRCRKQETLGSRRRVQVCQPRFASRYEAEANKHVVAGTGTTSGFAHLEGSDVWVRMKEQEKEFWETVSAATVEDDELREKFAELSRAKRALAAASQ
jgi:uracil-DNA glycosylase